MFLFLNIGICVLVNFILCKDIKKKTNNNYFLQQKISVFLARIVCFMI